MSTPSAAPEAAPITRAFPLDAPGSIWLIESGKLDIFLAPLDSGSPAGALTHVLRMEAGAAIFALPNIGPIGFLASPAAATSVRQCPLADLTSAQLSAHSATWVEALSKKLSLAPEPGKALSEFNEFAASELVRARIRTDEEEAARLTARTRADQKLITVAVRSLAQASRKTSTDDAVTNPLAAACLAVARAAGIPLRIPQSVINGTAKDPQRAIARYSAVRSRRLILVGDWWKTDSAPMLSFIDEDKRPVAILPRGRGYDLFDPSTNATTRIDRQIAQSLTGVAYVYYWPFPNRVLRPWDVMLAGLPDSRHDLWIIAFAGLLASVLGLAGPYATGIVFDSIVPGSERGQLFQTVALIVASAVAVSLISVTRGYAILRVTGRMESITQAALWDRLLNLPVTFFRNYSAGDLARRSLAISQIYQMLTGGVITAILSGLFSFTSFFLLFHYSPSLAALATLLAGTALAVTVGAGMVQAKLYRQVTDKTGRISGMVFQFIGGVAKFKVSGTEGRAFARWASAFGEQRKLASASQNVDSWIQVFNGVFHIAALGIIYWVAAGKFQSGTSGLSTGSFLAFNAAFAQLMGAVMALGSGILLAQKAVPVYERAKPIFETLPEVNSGKADPGELTGAIEVNHLAFRYSPDMPIVLRDVSLSIRPGEFVAIVGSSGSGKSTLLRLLLGFEKPAAGAVYYDGQDLAGLDVQEVRRQIGVVLQNGKLQPGDILTNIIGSRPLTVDHAWEAARMAGLEDDIKSLPMGMYTMVSEGGKGLSGGQRQRLMIARAVVGKPSILLLDEATSALDNRTQEIVSRAMEQMKVTRVAIAHRLTTVMKADRIVVLDHGVVVQAGTYDELINQEGFFAGLAKRQLA